MIKTYNPFMYIKSETDVQKLITKLLGITTKERGTPPEPFWEYADRKLLTALFLYTWMEKPKEEQNFRTVMDLLAKAEIRTDARGNRLASELDRIFDELETRSCENSDFEGNGFICRHPAVLAYNKVMRGAADTVRLIIISVNVRLDIFKLIKPEKKVKSGLIDRKDKKADEQ
jgi:type IV secretion system protein VirD4